MEGNAVFEPAVKEAPGSALRYGHLLEQRSHDD
jgi:hypothetical protein